MKVPEWPPEMLREATGWGCGSVAEHLLSMCKALGSLPSTPHCREGEREEPGSTGGQARPWLG